ncbi:hcalcium-binding protein [Ruegeria sp. ANG-R]|uniref:M10 family metallopeptidase C-terminal domain-containing protein n=1 Tax=Ruegeria sp. ANG-R TaxID=1577903 RepID=UPI0005807774|nr:calcium-binding protein [Ruegeria sp. ANG-R]KIC40498.1 hcalcium-binding protein [Ruegeria sp. ANG-R]
MMLQFERVVATGTAALDSGIGDTALKTFNGETYLYSTTGRGGGIVSWHLVEGASPQEQDQQYFGASITHQVGRIGTPVHLAGNDRLILDVDTATGLVGYSLNADGTIGALQETGGLTGGGDIASAVQMTIGTSNLLVLAHEDTDQIGSYRINGDGSLSPANSVAASATVLKTLQSGSNHFVITADTAGNTISSYTVNQGTGALSEVDGNEAIRTLGINTPTAVEAVQAYGKSWVVVAGVGSNSLSVLELASNGQLKPADHVLDTLHTRFASVQDIAAVQVEGRVFVVAGGGDDGITLFTMTPDGQLVHMDSFADTLDSGLQNVQTISVAPVGDELQIFAASQQDAGLTQLSVSIADLGLVAEGYGTVTGTAQGDMLSGGILDTTLHGGAGDDILITGTSATTMTGGAGADTYVIRESSGPTVITDFQAGIDRLDLSDYPFLRTPAQLDFTSTAQGARISYRDEVIELHSDTGATLTSEQVFGAGFDGPDHIPVNLDSGPDNNTSAGVAGRFTLSSASPNAALGDAELRFTPDGGSALVAQANAQGEFELDLPDGTFPGQLDITKSYSTASSEITALDALQVLRMSVGLDPIWGPAAAENFIAADITRDGAVNALDALAILQVAVGQPTEHDAEWVFLEANADLSGISRNNVVYETGAEVTAVDGALSVDMTSILLGNIEAV